MADILLSYSPSDADRAKRLADALATRGWGIWRSVPPGAENYSSPLSERHDAAACVLVLWSRDSVSLPWVITQAQSALDRDVLVQAVLDDVEPPHWFRIMPWTSLTGWSGDPESDEVRALAARIAPHVMPPPALAPSHVFVCYRREDSQSDAGRIHDHLTAEFGEAVFMDVDSVPYGADFIDHVDGRLAVCAVMVVVIGRSWTTITDQQGRRRLDRPDDLVRGEIAGALERKIPIVPVLVQNAAMPGAEELPEDIRALTRRHALELSFGRWHHDMEQLSRAIRRFVSTTRREAAPSTLDRWRNEPARTPRHPGRVRFLPRRPAMPDGFGPTDRSRLGLD